MMNALCWQAMAEDNTPRPINRFSFTKFPLMAFQKPPLSSSVDWIGEYNTTNATRTTSATTDSNDVNDKLACAQEKNA